MSSTGPISPHFAYRHPDGSPRLRDSWVLYLDGLGTREAARTITDEGLRRIQQVEDRYNRFLHHDNNETHQQALHFTDDVVLAVPDDDPDLGRSVRAIQELLWGTAWYLMGVGVELGRVMRGGIARGPASIDRGRMRSGFLDPNIAHGAGLVDAVELEHRAGVPRILVSDTVLSRIEWYLKHDLAPLDRVTLRVPLLIDTSDHEVFLDYLGFFRSGFEPSMIVLTESGEYMANADALSKYRTVITKGLAHSESKVAAKYLWLSEYWDYCVGPASSAELIGAGNAAHFRPWSPASP